MTETKVFSGYRLKFLDGQDKYQIGWAELVRCVTPFAPAIELASKENYFIDDSLRRLDALSLLMFGLQDGELFVCSHDGNLVGLMTLTGIEPGRYATWEVWAHPFYRTDYKTRKLLSKFAHEMLDYAFKPFAPIKDGGGLGLKKIKAEIAIHNRPALRSARALGFREVGIAHLDGLFHSRPSDMVLMELLNPVFLNLLEVGVINSVEEKLTSPTNTRTSPGVCTTSSVRGTARPTDSNPKGVNTNGSNDHGRRRRKPVASVVATEQQSVRPKRPRKV